VIRRGTSRAAIEKMLDELSLMCGKKFTLRSDRLSPYALYMEDRRGTTVVHRANRLPSIHTYLYGMLTGIYECRKQ
jgi:hypothetical protein